MARDETVTDLDALVTASQSVKRPFEWQAFLNIAFLAGHQWVAWDGNMLYEPQVEEWREKVVDNRIQPFVRTEIAKMTKTRPQWTGIPDSQSDEDIAGARYAELALDDVWRRHDLVRKLRAALMWSRTTPAGFWKVWWDKTIGEPRDVLVYSQSHPEPTLRGKSVKDNYQRPVDPGVMDQLPAELAQYVDTAKVSRGDVCIELRSFFDIYPDPLCGEEGLEAAEWVAEESVYSRDYCERHFPDFADRLKYDSEPSSGISESRMPGFAPNTGTTTGKAKGAKIREYWSKDKHTIWSGSLKLEEESNSYPWLPYVMFRGIHSPGRFWPDNVVNHLRPRQVSLNKALSQIEENAERIGNPPLLVPSTMGDDWRWYGLPGEEVHYANTGSPNDRPGFMDVPRLPEYVLSIPDRAVQSMMEIGGQHEVSGAQVPTGVTAASAINLLQEQDDTRLGPDIADMEQSLTHAGNRILWCLAEYRTDEQHIAVASEEGQWDVEAFKGSMTKGCSRIEVRTNSGMPQSKAAKQAAIQQYAALFAQNGQIVNAREWKRWMDQMEMGGLSAVFAEIDRDERQVQEENRQLSLGAEFEINAYDNDQAHVEGHQDFQKTARYARLDPQVKQNFEAHVAAHRDRVTQLAMASQPPPAGPPAGQAGMPAAGSPPTGASTPTGPPAPGPGAQNGAPPPVTFSRT